MTDQEITTSGIVTLMSNFEMTDASLTSRDHSTNQKKDAIITAVEQDIERGSLSDIDTIKPSTEVSRGLKSRHVQFIALGGAIGTGLFIGSGTALSSCGPAPLLISYSVMSFFVWAIMNQMTEMVVLIPLSGESSMASLAGTYLNRPSSFMCGWNCFYAMSMVVPTEITACALLIEYWTDANAAIFVTIFMILATLLSLLPVKIFGESEFCVSIIKILTILGLILVGVVIFFGGGPAQHKVLGFHYWNTPGAFNSYLVKGSTGAFLAVWKAIIKSGFAFVMIPEITSSCSAEAAFPRKNMPRACQRFVYRLAVFYVLGCLVIGVIVGYDNKTLNEAISSGKANAAASPFVIGIQEAGIRILPHIINACILTSAYSCSTSELYGASRVLHSLALRGDAPKFFSKVNKYGVPYYSVAATSLFGVLAYLNCSKSSLVVFNWLSNIATISGFVNWVFVSITYLRFRKITDYLKINDRVPYRRRGQRALAYASAIFFALLAITNGFYVFIAGNWNVSDFFTCYVTIGFVGVLFIGSSIYYKEWTFRDMDVVGREIMPKIDQADQEEKEEYLPPPKNWVERVWRIVV